MKIRELTNLDTSVIKRYVEITDNKLKFVLAKFEEGWTLYFIEGAKLNEGRTFNVADYDSGMKLLKDIIEKHKEMEQNDK